MRATLVILSFCLVTVLWSRSASNVTTFQPFESTIGQTHELLRAGKVNCRDITEAYLKRIAAYDQSTKLNSIVLVNPQALADAEALDSEFRRTRKLRPLHGIPIIVKDNFDTKGLQTTAGSSALKGSMPPDDAFQVKKLREAGAVILAKSNMAEWAFSPFLTESSIAGITRNPYDLDRVPAGSSGGTAAAIAASFGAVGLGSDTGNSIRGPSSHNALVGIRSTMGLTSRNGIIPLYVRNDIGGPMARTVEDAVRVLEVVAGYDPADPITKMSQGRIPKNYTQFLRNDGLKGARLALFRRYVDAPTTDPQIKTLVEKAVIDLKAQGATVIDPFDLPEYDELTRNIWCNSFHHDVNAYLSSLGPSRKYRDLSSIVDSGLYSSYIERRLKDSIKTPDSSTCTNVYEDPKSIALRNALLKLMDEGRIDAIIYPTWSNAPRRVGDVTSPAGDNSQMLSPQTGFPAITVPMGFTYGSLPAGLTFLGRLFSEGDLIKFVYAYEQATKHRRPPERFGPIQ